MKVKIGMMLAAAAWLLLCVGCASLPEELSAPDITLPELETKMQKAMDPQGRFASARTFLQNQVVRTDSGWLEAPQEQRLEVRFQQPSSFKLTTYDENEPLTALIFDKTRGWSVDYKRRRITELGKNQLEELRVLALLTRPDSRLRDIFSVVKIQNCRIGDEDYYKLTCQRPGGAELDIYVDKKDFLTRRMKSDFKLGSTRVRYDSSVEGYSLYEGIMIPTETRLEQNGQVSTSKVTDYRLNAPMSPDEFKPPIF